ncbi:PDR/VanB family oxidoreductase [Rhodococcus sp. WAY2]|uniref:PDR/VanB family oxidoreductase n=1 Tax=Rhodococcus sp. WAY2 TaxID=2663121 RepID=UPI001F320DA6|nr:PDR/VanB family oxidoreductase [Rhodococcus sp. WAY2]
MNDQPEAAQLNLVVADAVPIATDVLMLTLTDPDRGDLPEWTPGSHIDVTVDGLTRQYSLCGDPDDRQTWRIAVLREKDGRGGSRAIHEYARPGLPVQVRGPRNHFALRQADEYLFIAGGIGITPLLPMIAAAETKDVPWRLVYGARSADRFCFVDRLGTYGGRVTLQPEETTGMLDLKELVTTANAGVAIYACGPSGLLDALGDLCGESGRALYVERFAADPRTLDEGPETSFEVVAETSGVAVTVPPGTSIIRALEDAGVEVFTSCEEGVCGTCETRVLAGIPDHRDSVLDDDERAANEVMMICVSRARTPSITLDI